MSYIVSGLTVNHDNLLVQLNLTNSKQARVNKYTSNQHNFEDTEVSGKK